MKNECSGRCRFLSENTANSSVFKQNLGFFGGVPYIYIYIHIYSSELAGERKNVKLDKSKFNYSWKAAGLHQLGDRKADLLRES